jgi:dolichol-phosphate mannosyltransferase
MVGAAERMKFDFTVIIPTLNEESTIVSTIQNVQDVFKKENLNAEILIVDDNSTDNTISLINELGFKQGNLNLIIRQRDHGLSQSIVEGFEKAASNIYIIMDADGQHPAEKIPVLYQKIKEGNDIVIGSRYKAGGEIKNWSNERKVISRGATFLARLFFPNITDPVSGFFAVRRDVVLNAPLKPQGYKILLEILGKGYWKNVEEIPFTFGARESGASKLKEKTIVEYVKQIIDLARFSLTNKNSPAYAEIHRAVKFMAVGFTGVIVNVGLLFFLTEIFGLYYLLSSIVGIEASIISNFILNDLWTFGDIDKNKYSLSSRLVRFHAVSFTGILINFSTLYLLTSVFGIYYIISNLVGILLAFAWNFLVNRRYTWQKI